LKTRPTLLSYRAGKCRVVDPKGYSNLSELIATDLAPLLLCLKAKSSLQESQEQSLTQVTACITTM